MERTILTPRSWRWFAGLALAGVLLGGAADAQPSARGYLVEAGADCGGYPRLSIGMTPGMCAGLVYAADPAAAAPHLQMPRTLIALSDKEWIVTDLGNWQPGRGSVWRVVAEPGRAPAVTRLISGLDMPHGLERGPDGGLYVGEMGRIFRFDPRAADPAASRQVVVDGLPDNRLHDNRHPLSSFIFDADGALLVNVGAPSDQCLPNAGAPRPDRCAEGEGRDGGGVVRRYAYLGNGRWNPAFTVFARGLRNSLALARSPTGTLLQGENSIDLDTPGAPFDEFNVLKAGAHYGWPYCVDLGEPAPGWRGSAALDCKSAAHEKPALLLPPHAAPLGLVYYQGAMFPKLRNRVLVSFHGYRSIGARVMAYAVDAKGVPLPTERPRYPAYVGGKVTMRAYPARVAASAAGPLVLTRDWDNRPGRQPRGWPVGLAIAPDGSIWVADDRNGAIIRFAADGV